ncbi:3-dehydroquinate synthase [Hirschia litorea]|uniref:3-dehydroquinate synthase n=1 Tax=Hirschia litorea TaxID=1199156 RepID=A0ABW2IJK9_9PROT
MTDTSAKSSAALENASGAKRVNVALGDRSYDIHIASGLLSLAGGLIKPILKQQRVFIVTDENVAKVHLGTLKAGLATQNIEAFEVVLPAGEATKCFAVLESTIDQLMAQGADRNDVVIALGGGVIGDLTGLVAGLLKRGMRFVQVPTTLLAQVDSSVGGKTAINSKIGKNLVGLFNQPEMVIADQDVLQTLPVRELRAGLAEVIKYGLIDDLSFFEYIELNAEKLNAASPEALAEAVRVSCESKARIVSEDETERGKRALLNLGHTFAHALERANGFGPALLHGEAVGCGMAMAMRYSQALGLCSGQEADRAEKGILALGLETDVRKLAGGPYEANALLEHMMHDKKAEQGKLTLILAKGIGQSYIEKQVDVEHLLAFLKTETAV